METRMEPNRFVRSKHPFRVCVGVCGEMGGLRRRTNPRTVAPPTMATKTMANALAKSVRELRIHFCQTSEASAGTRDFVLSSYKTLKAAAPELPILVREANGAGAKMYARFDFGVEKSVSLEGLDKKGVANALQNLLQQGKDLPKNPKGTA